MDLGDSEADSYNEIAAHSIITLAAEDLVRQWSLVTVAMLHTKHSKDAPGPGFIFKPTQAGIILFGVAQGLRENDALLAFSDAERSFAFAGAPPVPDGACFLDSLPTWEPPEE
jgi:hypothetical protein